MAVVTFDTARAAGAVAVEAAREGVVVVGVGVGVGAAGLDAIGVESVGVVVCVVVFGAVTVGVVVCGAVAVGAGFGTAEEAVLSGASEADWAVLPPIISEAGEVATPVVPVVEMAPSARAFGIATQSARTASATVAAARPTVPRYKPQTLVDSAPTKRCLPTLLNRLAFRIYAVANLNCGNRRQPRG